MAPLTCKSLKKHSLISGKFIIIHETVFYSRLFPKLVDLKNLHKFYDVSGDGAISYNEFVNALCSSKLSARGLTMVEEAWCKLDKKKSGECTGKDFQDNYKLDCAKFCDYFPSTQGCNLDGKVTKDEFE